MNDRFAIEKIDLTFSISNTALFNVQIKRAVGDIGASTSLTITMTLSNPIPVRGKILISFTKDQYVFLGSPSLTRLLIMSRYWEK